MPSFQSSINFSVDSNVDHGELSLLHVGSMVDEVSVQIGKIGNDICANVPVLLTQIYPPNGNPGIADVHDDPFLDSVGMNALLNVSV